jgi:hypothetical protein
MCSLSGSLSFFWKRVVHCQIRVTCRRGSCVWPLADLDCVLVRSLTSVPTGSTGIGCCFAFRNTNPVSVAIAVARHHKKPLIVSTSHRKRRWRDAGIRRRSPQPGRFRLTCRSGLSCVLNGSQTSTKRSPVTNRGQQTSERCR